VPICSTHKSSGFGREERGGKKERGGGAGGGGAGAAEVTSAPRASPREVS
jgi:hypothetical protein